MVRSTDDENQIARRLMLVNGRILQVGGWIMFGGTVTASLTLRSLILLVGALAGLVLVIGGTAFRTWAKRDTPTRPPSK